MKQFLALVAGITLALNSVEYCISAEADVLITEAEAALPSLPDAALPFRGVTRGPAIEQVEPGLNIKTIQSPAPIKIRFFARNKAEIDAESVRVTYVKNPLVDLTTRLKPRITKSGIFLENAAVPAGLHVLRIDVTDTVGRTSTAIIRLMVAPR